MRTIFRLLKDWKVKRKRDRDLSGCVIIHPKKNVATVYDYHGRKPVDFDFHELLHCALTALRRMDRRKIKELKQAEEEFIRDICKYKLRGRK